MEFIFLFLFRVLSGLQNGLGYARLSTGRKVASYLLALLAFLPVLVYLSGNPAKFVLLGILLGSCISALGAIGVEDSFNEKMKILPRDIHLWEMLATAGVTIGLAIMGGNLILILASIYPALIIHKGLINTFSGVSWWYHGTDDATGKTFSIPLLGIQVPRMGIRGRQVAAVASLIFAAIAWAIPVSVNMYEVWTLFF